MKKLLYLLIIAGLAGCSGTKTTTTTTTPVPTTTPSLPPPPPPIPSPSVLVVNKQRIKNNDAELMPAYKQLIKEADKALKEGPFSVMEKTKIPPSGNKHDYMSIAPYHWPDPANPNGPYIRKDGQTNPEVKEYLDKEYMPKMCKMVQILSLAYYFSDDERYAQHASLLLKTWYLDTATRMNPNMDFAQSIKGVNTGRGAGLIDARNFLKVIDGIPLLQNSPHWKPEYQKGMQDWFSEFLNWMQTSKNGTDELNAKNNHGTFYDALRLSIALFTNNNELAKKVITSATKRLDYQMDEEGKFPKEMERTISFHYSSFNVEAFFKIAKMAEKTGFDLWNYTSPSGKSLKKAFEFLRPFLTNSKPWTGPQIKPYEFEGDAFPLLMDGAIHYNCSECREAIKTIGKEKSKSLLINLLY